MGSACTLCGQLAHRHSQNRVLADCICTWRRAAAVTKGADVHSTVFHSANDDALSPAAGNAPVHSTDGSQHQLRAAADAGSAQTLAERCLDGLQSRTLPTLPRAVVHKPAIHIHSVARRAVDGCADPNSQGSTYLHLDILPSMACAARRCVQVHFVAISAQASNPRVCRPRQRVDSSCGAAATAPWAAPETCAELSYRTVVRRAAGSCTLECLRIPL